MTRYKVKPGYCLHLPYQRFCQPGEEIDFSGDLEVLVLKGQSWKVEPAVDEKTPPEPEKPGPEKKSLKGPPKDRAVKPEEAVAK